MKIMNTLMTAMAATMMVLVSTVDSSAQTPQLTDPEIASVAVTANQIDIDYAAIAKERSKDAEDIRFAETMANNHKAVIAQAVALVTKLKVTTKNKANSQ